MPSAMRCMLPSLFLLCLLAPQQLLDNSSTIKFKMREAQLSYFKQVLPPVNADIKVNEKYYYQSSKAKL